MGMTLVSSSVPTPRLKVTVLMKSFIWFPKAPTMSPPPITPMRSPRSTAEAAPAKSSTPAAIDAMTLLPLLKQVTTLHWLFELLMGGAFLRGRRLDTSREPLERRRNGVTFHGRGRSCFQVDRRSGSHVGGIPLHEQPTNEAHWPEEDRSYGARPYGGGHGSVGFGGQGGSVADEDGYRLGACLLYTSRCV